LRPAASMLAGSLPREPDCRSYGHPTRAYAGADGFFTGAICSYIAEQVFPHPPAGPLPTYSSPSQESSRSPQFYQRGSRRARASAGGGEARRPHPELLEFMENRRNRQSLPEAAPSASGMTGSTWRFAEGLQWMPLSAS